MDLDAFLNAVRRQKEELDRELVRRGDEFPDVLADRQWVEPGGERCYLVKAAGTSRWCGYVRFPVHPLIEPGMGGIVRYLPVHGGVTYVVRAPGGSTVYGFDCGHPGDERFKAVHDHVWLRGQVRVLACAVAEAAKVEHCFLLAHPVTNHQTRQYWANHVVQQVRLRFPALEVDERLALLLGPMAFGD
jgi:hypothetical protein